MHATAPTDREPAALRRCRGRRHCLRASAASTSLPRSWFPSLAPTPPTTGACSASYSVPCAPTWRCARRRLCVACSRRRRCPSCCTPSVARRTAALASRRSRGGRSALRESHPLYTTPPTTGPPSSLPREPRSGASPPACSLAVTSTSPKPTRRAPRSSSCSADAAPLRCAPRRPRSPRARSCRP